MRMLTKSDLGYITREPDIQSGSLPVEEVTYRHRAMPVNEYRTPPKAIVSERYIHPRLDVQPTRRFRPSLRRWSLGLSEGETPATTQPQGFWGNLGSTLGGIVSTVLPTFAQLEIAKRQVSTGATLYTNQNIDILRRQAEFEAQDRANRAAAAAGSTSAPINTNTLLMIGGGLAGLLLFLNMRKK